MYWSDRMLWKCVCCVCVCIVNITEHVWQLYTVTFRGILKHFRKQQRKQKQTEAVTKSQRQRAQYVVFNWYRVVGVKGGDKRDERVVGTSAAESKVIDECSSRKNQSQSQAILAWQSIDFPSGINEKYFSFFPPFFFIIFLFCSLTFFWEHSAICDQCFQTFNGAAYDKVSLNIAYKSFAVFVYN